MADFIGTLETTPEQITGNLSSDQSLTGKLSSLGIPGNGIAAIEKTATEGLVDTYTITYDDGATTVYQITNGNGIANASFNEDNTLTLEFSDGTSLTTGVLRGNDGEEVLLRAEDNVVSYKYESDPDWTVLVDLTGFADEASNAAATATEKAAQASNSATRAETAASTVNSAVATVTQKAEETANSAEQAAISQRRAEAAAEDGRIYKNTAGEYATASLAAQENTRIYSERTLGYANNAAASAQAAKDSETAAALSASGIDEAVTAAQTSATQAASSADQAREYAENVDDLAVQAMEDYLDEHPAVQSINGKTGHVTLSASDVGALPSSTTIPSKISDLTDDSDFATNGDLVELQTKLNTLADSDDQTLDQLSEIVAYIKDNKNLIDGITTGKVSVSDIVDNLTSTATNKPLSAKQGKALKDLIDAIVIPTNISAFTNDAGYLTEHQDISGKQDVISDLATIRSGAALGATAIQAEADPTVPAWAKAATKPAYTAAEVGALPNDTYIPTKVSDLTNDAGYLTEHQDISGKANTADLAAVATSGDYDDLSNKPTIPTKVSDLTDDSGHYTKPSGGIPTSDLADGVVPDLSGYVTKDSIDNAGITDRTYTSVYGGEFIVTTAEAEGYDYPMATINKGWRPTYYSYRITFTDNSSNEVKEYVIPGMTWYNQDGVYSYLGNLSLYDKNTSSIPDNIYTQCPFLIKERYDDPNYLMDIFTEQAGSYTFLVEKIEKTKTVLSPELIYGLEYSPIRIIRNTETSKFLGTSIGLGNVINVPKNSFAIGAYNTINANDAIAIGQSNSANGSFSFVEGYNSRTSGSVAHAEGYQTRAVGAYSHSEGCQTTASGLASHSSGVITTASGYASNATGYNTTANSFGMYAIGQKNVADTVYTNWVSDTSYAVDDCITYSGFGFKCITANSDSTFTEEHWQLLNNDGGSSAFVVGNGGITRNSTPSNAYKVDWEGNGYYNGDVYVNCAADSTGGTKLVSETDYASSSAAGVVKVNSDYGIYARSDHSLGINAASDSQIKAGTNSSRPIVPVNEHTATFYGLAKAAGDTTQATSSSAVGTYTEEAKTAIKSMLGVEKTITVSGTAPTITAEENARYICGEVVSLNFTPSANGICDVRFTSGSTVTTLTIPSTVKFPDWFDSTKLEANTVYEINVLDGIYGAVMTWAV